MRRLTGARAIVTGGSRGIGTAIAQRLGQEGCNVVVNCRRDTPEARAVLAAIESGGAQAVLALGDIRDEEAVESVARTAVEAFGGIDILVNNAGIWLGSRLKDAKASEWREIMETNLLGTMLMTRAALPHLTESPRGRIIMLSSVIGMIGFPGDTAYATTKAGLIGFTRSLAKEVAKRGVTVNAVAPGYIATEMTASVPEKGRDLMLSTIPLGRIGTPEEVAAAVAFLAAEGDYITGHVLVVDGGMAL